MRENPSLSRLRRTKSLESTAPHNSILAALHCIGSDQVQIRGLRDPRSMANVKICKGGLRNRQQCGICKTFSRHLLGSIISAVSVPGSNSSCQLQHSNDAVDRYSHQTALQVHQEGSKDLHAAGNAHISLVELQLLIEVETYTWWSFWITSDSRGCSC